MLPLSNLPVLCVFGCPDSCCCVMTASPNEEATASESLESRAQAAAKAEEAVEPSFFSKLTSFLFGEREEAPTEEEAAALPVLAEAEEAIEQPPLPPRTRRLFSGAEPEMARGDFAVLGFWFVSCIIFTCGCQPIPWLTCGREKKRDPLFYTGIVLISIGCLLVVCYFNRDTCRSDDRAVDRPLPDVGPAEVVSRQESLPGEEAEAETSTVSPSMKILGVVGLAATAFGGAVASGAVF